MNIILHPADRSENEPLDNLYNRAISEAVELFIVTVYLTDWAPTSSLREDCEELSFIVGTDFGITNKNACRSVLKWLPMRMKNDFLAADSISGFHPKLVAWKTKAGDYFLVLGSSNLTQAAFSKNYEANIFTEISSDQYVVVKEWIYSIRLLCCPISEDWLERYKEAERLPSKSGTKKPAIISLSLPAGDDIEQAIRRRRQQHKAFSKIRVDLTNLIEGCARGQTPNEKFYGEMMELWGHHESRFQGRGFEISGKHCEWGDVCASLFRILSASPKASIAALDNVVRKEIDRLADARNPSRGAGLSEMLCHFFPERYPLLNKPVKTWLQYNKYRSPSKATEGAKYIDLAVKLRQAIKENIVAEARNLAELDHVIWQWYHSEYGS